MHHFSLVKSPAHQQGVTLNLKAGRAPVGVQANVAARMTKPIKNMAKPIEK